MKDMNTKQAGFTLIELSISLVILAIIISLSLLALARMLKSEQERVTFERMEVIADAISLYAQTRMRVPCPADPSLARDDPNYGRERVGTDQENTPGGVLVLLNSGCRDPAGTAEGIIPFATLNLPEEASFDKFGNYFTYHVSTGSALQPITIREQRSPTSVNQIGVRIGDWCRTRPRWHADINYDGETDAYLNPAKAAFCCGVDDSFAGPLVAGEPIGPDGDVRLTQTDHDYGTSRGIPSLSRAINRFGGRPQEYASLNNDPPDQDRLRDNFSAIFPAYLIISHGQNGAGAYARDGSRDTAFASFNSLNELENANGDNLFVVPDRTSPNVDGSLLSGVSKAAIDDILFWQTPAQIISRVGNMSCSRP